ncbi:MAG: alpha-galactosidase [Opitutae bacterium]|nr:alpha-galactosidase [Opitutae bacterium]
MKIRHTFLSLCLVLTTEFDSAHASEPAPAAPVTITIATARSTLELYTGADGRLYQRYYGATRAHLSAPKAKPAREGEFHPPAGNGFILEPALQATHADGNTSTELRYASHETTAVDANIAVTRIKLQDPEYPFAVTLCFRAYRAEDVIEQWVEIRHDEPKAVRLDRFASAAPVFQADSYWLTQLQGDFMREAELQEECLAPGIKVLDSKLGVRAHQMRPPAFLLSLAGPAREESGEVIGGSLGWAGSFQFAFEVDHRRQLRALCGINPFGSAYQLDPARTFRTPPMFWAWSDAGKGGLSRNFHRWARQYGMRDGAKPRPVLLNNWEATYFKFDEAKIVSLFDGAKELGADLFLLDDGWFGNKHPRDDDHRGLGDWQVNTKKLPHGLSYLADEAKKRSIGFGIWIEPEMVNPLSELFEQHPDWVIRQPKRELQFHRDQLILDLTRPEVQAFARRVIDDTLAPNPGISYVKWDCNRYVMQPGSSYLPADRQTHLLIDYQWALYDVMRHMAEKYPKVMAMLCSGGAGRADFSSMQFFHSFWPSDNTDPMQRIYIQWGFGHFFPPGAVIAHITDKGHRPIKFTCDVALTGALGVDRDVSRWTPAERATVAATIALYHNRIRDLVQQGDQYRLESPYEGKRAALDYVSPDRARAVLFVYQLGETAATLGPVKPRGLDPAQRYRVREINLPAKAKSRLALHDQVVSGASLMSEGVQPPLRHAVESLVVEFVAER